MGELDARRGRRAAVRAVRGVDRRAGPLPARVLSRAAGASLAAGFGGRVAEWTLDVVDEHRDQHMRAARVLVVTGLLRQAGVAHHLAGGWGVDALLGLQTRRHSDLDVLLDDFDGQIGAALWALRVAGYRPWYPTRPGRWVQRSLAVEDGAGSRIEFLAVDWGQVGDGLGTPGAREADLQARCWTTGTISGHSVPCLSVEAQRLLHGGYELRRTDHVDLGLLPGCPDDLVRADGRTTLVAPVALPEPLLGLRSHHDPSAGAGIPPHVTVCFPWMPAGAVDATVRSTLQAVLAPQLPVEVTFTSTAWFDRRVVYLAPDDPRPLVALSDALQAAFPAWPPYDGRFEHVVPHLTVGEDGPRRAMEVAGARARRHLPLRATLDQVWLMAPTTGGTWCLLDRIGVTPPTVDGAASAATGHGRS